jgi:hypothetical protein
MAENSSQWDKKYIVFVYVYNLFYDSCILKHNVRFFTKIHGCYYPNNNSEGNIVAIQMDFILCGVRIED